jgi:hypothetical protein
MICKSIIGKSFQRSLWPGVHKEMRVLFSKFNLGDQQTSEKTVFLPSLLTGPNLRYYSLLNPLFSHPSILYSLSAFDFHSHSSYPRFLSSSGSAPENLIG